MIHLFQHAKISLRLEICQKCFQHQHLSYQKRQHERSPDHNQNNHDNNNNTSRITQIKRVQFSYNDNSNNNNGDYEEDYQYHQHYTKLTDFVDNFYDGSQFNVQRNIPFKFLSKLPVSKLSSKRFLNQSTNKIVQFPRKNSFQIFFSHIFLFSKLQTGEFPDHQILNGLLQCLHQEYLNDSLLLLNKLAQFQHNQMEWTDNPLKASLYEYLYASSIQSEPTKQNMVKLLKDILNGNNRVQIDQSDKKKVIPYTFYGSIQKMTKMESIYLSKETRLNYGMKINMNTSNQKKALINKQKSQHNQSSRPCSSKLGYSKRSTPSGIKKTPSIFSLIKRENIFDELDKPKPLLLTKKKINLQNDLAKLLSEQKKTSFSKISDKKLYVNKNFQVIKNDMQVQSDYGSSMMTNTFNSLDSSSNMKISLVKQLRKNNNINGMQLLQQNSKNSKKSQRNLLCVTQTQKSQSKDKICNSRVLIRSHRKSYFLNEKLANKMINQLKLQQLQEIKANPTTNNKSQSNIQSNTNSFNTQNFQNIQSEKDQLSIQIKKNAQNSSQNSMNQNIQTINSYKQDHVIVTTPEVNFVNLRGSRSRKSSIFSEQRQYMRQAQNNAKETEEIAIQTSQIQIVIPDKKKDIKKQSSLSDALQNQMHQSRGHKVSIMKKSQRQRQRQNQNSYMSQSGQSGSAKAFYDKMHPQTQYKQALITKKFAQSKNYEMKLANNAFRLPNYHHCFDFSINCIQQHKQYQIKSINSVYKNICIFPKVFQQISSYSSLSSNSNSSTSVLSEVVNILLKFNPLTIIRIFNNNSIIHPAGLYSVWLYHTQINMFKPVFINDQIPFYTASQNHSQKVSSLSAKLQPIYAKLSSQNSIWYMILEKAIAKIVGGYYELSQMTSGDLFRILTGCPIVNLKTFTPLKLKKMLKQKIFQNKKAYVYALTNKNQSDLKFDRIVGVSFDQFDHTNSFIQFQNNSEVGSHKISMQKFIQKYCQISLIFFSITYQYNQICLPPCKKVSKLLNLYLINQNDQKNTVFITLGGFSNKNNNKSRISIYREAQQYQNPHLQHLQITDPLLFYESKYEYVGQIQQTGNYFFQTKLSYGKFLCLIQSKFQINQKYYMSLYSQKPIKIDEPFHNEEFQYFQEQATGIEKLMKSNLMKKKMKYQKDFPQKLLTRRFSNASDDQPQMNYKQMFKRHKAKAVQDSSDDSEKQNFYNTKSKSVQNWMKQRKFVDQNFEKKQMKKLLFDREQVKKMKQKRKKQKQKKQAQLQQMKQQKNKMILNIITKISSPTQKQEITKKRVPTHFQVDKCEEEED